MDLVDVSTRADWPVYLVLGLVCVLSVSVLIAPDYWWRLERSLVGWQYRDGHKIELSTAGRIAARLGAVVSIVIMCVVAGTTVSWTAASRVETEYSPPGDTVYYVGDPVESPGCVIRIVVCLRSDAVFPITVTEYAASESRPAGFKAMPDDTNLLLYVERRYFPTHLLVAQGERVTVTLYGKCAGRVLSDAYGSSTADCTADPTAALFQRGVVPVSLREPLGARTLIDGHRDAPVEPAT